MGNLSAMVNPSGKISLAFYFHADGRQIRWKLGSYHGKPSKQILQYLNAEYQRLRSGLTAATTTGLKVYQDTGNYNKDGTAIFRILVGPDAFLEQEHQRLMAEAETEPSDDPIECPPLPKEYLDRQKRKQFRFACMQYLDWFDSEKQSGVNERSLVGKLVDGFGSAPGLGELEPAQITGPQVQRILDAVRKKHPTTANSVKKVTSRLWSWLKRRGWVATREPILDLDAKAPPPRQRLFSEDEMPRLLTDCHPYYRALALSPLRLVEHTRVHWDRIDQDMNATVKVKDGREHVQPLTESYLSCRRTKRSGGGYLLPGRHGYTQLLRTSLSDLGAQWAAEVGIIDHHNHDWRKCFTSWGEKEHIAYDVLDACLSRKKAGLRAVYGLYGYLPEKREALTRWATYLDGLTAG
jgi:integrase